MVTFKKIKYSVNDMAFAISSTGLALISCIPTINPICLIIYLHKRENYHKHDMFVKHFFMFDIIMISQREKFRVNPSFKIRITDHDESPGRIGLLAGTKSCLFVLRSFNKLITIIKESVLLIVIKLSLIFLRKVSLTTRLVHHLLRIHGVLFDIPGTANTLVGYM